MSELCALRHEVAQLKKLVESTSEGLGLAGLYHEMQSLQQQVGELSKLLSADTKFSKTQSDAIPQCSGISGLHNLSEWLRWVTCVKKLL